MIQNLLLFSFLIFSLGIVIQGAHYANRYSTNIAKAFDIPPYIMGLFVIAIISILPELFISISAALKGIPEFGLGTLFGSNVIDVTLIIALVILFSGKTLKVEKSILKNGKWYMGAMFFSLLFGINGYYSRVEGIILCIVGLSYYFFSIYKGKLPHPTTQKERFSLRDLVFLTISMGALLLGAHFTVSSGINIANAFAIHPIFIGMFIIGFGTTLPEFFFSLRAAKNKNSSLVLGDILGTVIADATIVVGIMAILSPFHFEKRLIFITGFAMFISTCLLFYCMKTQRNITKKEAFILIGIYIIFATTEIFLSIIYH